jgi:GTPase SAR1 family protein
MKIIHQSGFSHDECARYKLIVYANVIHCMKCLISACARFRIPLETEENKSRADGVAAMEDTDVFSADVGASIAALWQDKGIRLAYDRRSEFQLPDSAPYYFSELDRLSQPDYVPSQQDVLRSRVRTTGIMETSFSFGGLDFRCIDVGGQRNERRKWIHCFQGCTAIIFMVSLSEYDQGLAEDESQNRMKEALLLFDEICNSRWFADTSIILFLNKLDLFREKIQRKNITCCFPEYRGPQTYEAALCYIRDRFLELNRSPYKDVYPYAVTATDTANIQRVFSAVKDIILRINLRRAGLL